MDTWINHSHFTILMQLKFDRTGKRKDTQTSDSLKCEVNDNLAKPKKSAVFILITCFITDRSGSACLFGRFKAANYSLIVSFFQMTGFGLNLPKLGHSVLVIIKAEVAMPGMFAISPLLFPMDSHFIITLAK